MRVRPWAQAVLTAVALAGCSTPSNPKASSSAKAEAATRITQLYTTTPEVPRGEKGTVCYGVENAKKVWLSPPRRELTASLTRCVEVEPSGKTTYTLTAEGADGKTVSQELTLGAGAARVHIVNVDISAAEVPAGGLVRICYTADNAAAVTIEPGHFRATERYACKVDQPQKTTTYVVRATGAGGDTDEEKVMIKVTGGR